MNYSLRVILVGVAFFGHIGVARLYERGTIFVCRDIPPLEQAIQFHGHICPGLLMGVRVAEFAQQHLKVAAAADEELLAVVENDGCGLDAIQSILGCTAGKGNLMVKPYGKNVYTIASRLTGSAVRIAQRYQPEPGPESRRYKELCRLSSLTPEEEAEKESLLAALFEQIMSRPFEEMFVWRDIDFVFPPRAGVYPTVQCARCHEGVMEPCAAPSGDGWLCPECYEGEGTTDGV